MLLFYFILLCVSFLVRGQDGTRETSGEEDADVFDFLTQLFGFQRDSVRNQR